MTYSAASKMCTSCGDTHQLAIPLPAYANGTYEFVCPATKVTVRFKGIGTIAKTVLSSVGSDRVVAKEVVDSAG